MSGPGAVAAFDRPASAGPSPAIVGSAGRLRVLTFSSLFPSTARPRHGIFVETRLRHLLREGRIDARVIAPVPWFPFRSPRFGSYARMAATPRRDLRAGGLQVSYPRYLMLPKVGTALQPAAMARAAAADLQPWLDEGWQPDLIDAHYFYPDGVAAALLAQRLGRPFVVTARGTDVNVIARLPGPGARVLWAARQAAAVVAVSSRLKQSLVELGVDAAKVVVLRNGVDTEVFYPRDRAAARESFGLRRRIVLACVGNLVPEKGFELAIDALPGLADAELIVVGEGPQQPALAERARRHGVAERVHFVGSMPQARLAEVYSAADALLLCSTREGWPNVVLESLACGTPVLATDVGAVGEMLTDPAVGRIVPGRDPRDFAAALAAMLQQAPDRQHVVRHAAAFDWASVSRGQLEVFARALEGAAQPAPLPC